MSTNPQLLHAARCAAQAIVRHVGLELLQSPSGHPLSPAYRLLRTAIADVEVTEGQDPLSEELVYVADTLENCHLDDANVAALARGIRGALKHAERMCTKLKETADKIPPDIEVIDPGVDSRLNDIAKTDAVSMFVEGHVPSESEVLGIIIAKHFQWDTRIHEAFADALEDANYHGHAAQVRQWTEDE